MLRYVVLFLIVPVAALLVAYVYSGPSADQFKDLIEPKLSHRPSEFVLQKKLIGDPNVVGAEAFGALFKKYFSTHGYTSSAPSPKARWPRGLEIPKNQWEGIYALSEASESNPDPSSSDGVEFVKWEYGQIAEILHIGPYTEEGPTIERLLKFIASNNREIVGDHEEEYVRGPKLFGLGDRKKFLTIIRYRVREKEKL